MRVVVIEDVQDIALLERAILEAQGHEVVVPVLFSHLQTPEVWAGVDAALVDLSLPKASGREILTWLKDNAPHVRRVCVTAYDPRQSGVASEEIDAQAFVWKPFTEKTLLEALQ